MKSHTIRIARRTDIPFLATLNAELQELHFLNRSDQFKPADTTEYKAWFEKLFENSSVTIWVAESGHKPVGYVVVNAKKIPEGPFFPARECWDLDQIGVTVSHRKRGICRALLLKVISEASAKKVREIELSSWAFNTTARRAFEKLGFVPKVVRYELPELGGNKDCSP